MKKEEKIKEIDRQIAKISLIELPGAIAFGLGLYIMFAGYDNAIHPDLDTPHVVNSLIFVGAFIMILCNAKIFSLIKEKYDLENK